MQHYPHISVHEEVQRRKSHLKVSLSNTLSRLLHVIDFNKMSRQDILEHQKIWQQRHIYKYKYTDV